jgi:hypothetical protein
MDFFAFMSAFGITIIAEVGFLLLMIVMKGLLRAATDQSDELGQVI